MSHPERKPGKKRTATEGLIPAQTPLMDYYNSQLQAQRLSESTVTYLSPIIQIIDMLPSATLIQRQTILTYFFWEAEGNYQRAATTLEIPVTQVKEAVNRLTSAADVEQTQLETLWDKFERAMHTGRSAKIRALLLAGWEVEDIGRALNDFITRDIRKIKKLLEEELVNKSN